MVSQPATRNIGGTCAPLSPLLTLDAVAELLAVPRKLADELVQTGQLHAVRIGGELRIRPEALRSFLDAAEDSAKQAGF